MNQKNGKVNNYEKIQMDIFGKIVFRKEGMYKKKED